MEDDSVSAADDLPRIHRLPKDVVNRIAAGEIIQRPVSALKEMLENSLDAGSTQINIVVKEGGNKLLQIQDNGYGIRNEDLPLLCERHATSKLSRFEDLTSISTLGFRGEALASISYVAHLTVTTMTPEAEHGYKVTYRDGVIDPTGPKPCAAVQGTTITVEDLFYNVPARKRALKNASDEFGRILDMVGCYAILRPEVGFTVKKQGEARADLHCLPASSRKDNIRNLFGAAVARNLLDFVVKKETACEAGAESEGLVCAVEGFMTTADYSGKKTIVVLFINGRPVECKPLKRAIELTYIGLLPKTAKPFLFLDIRLPGGHVDVNLHPTKREVGFLFQEELIKAICDAVEVKLTSSNAQRTFTQTQLPGAGKQATELDPEGSGELKTTAKRDKSTADNKLIRTDSRARTLDAFMRPPQASSPRESPREPVKDAGPEATAGQLLQAPMAAVRRRGAERGVIRVREQWEAEETARSLERSRSFSQRPNPANPSELTSIQTLLAEGEKHTHQGLLEVIRNHTFVGLVDATLALLQHGTRLYMADLTEITREMFYQQVLARFEQMKSLKVEGNPSIKALALLALEMDEAEHPEEAEDEGVSKEEVSALIEELLVDKAEMLLEYVGLKIEPSGELSSLPQLIESYHPDLDYLPACILSLARDVDWGAEQECFQGIAEALAELYCWKAPRFPEAGASEAERANVQTADPGGSATGQSQEGQPGYENSQSHRPWTVQHVLFPALRMFWKPQKERAQDGSMLELTRLEHLYRIFERC